MIPHLPLILFVPYLALLAVATYRTFRQNHASAAEFNLIAAAVAGVVALNGLIAADWFVVGCWTFCAAICVTSARSAKRTARRRAATN